MKRRIICHNLSITKCVGCFSSDLHFLWAFLLAGFQEWKTTCLDCNALTLSAPVLRTVTLRLFSTSLDPSTSVKVSEREGDRKPTFSQTKGLLTQNATCLLSTGQKHMGSVRAERGHRDPSPVIPLCPPEISQTACLFQATKSSASCHSHSHQTLNRSPVLFTVGPICPLQFSCYWEFTFYFWWHDMFSVINKVKLLNFITEAPSDFQLWCLDKWNVVYYF